MHSLKDKFNLSFFYYIIYIGDNMKYMVVSDIHGSTYYGELIPKIFEKEECDKLIILGDLYYHGPRNPLTKEYEPSYVAKILNNMKDKIICIRGNCDAYVDEQISEFPFNNSVTMEINGKNFFFTHGHLYNESNLPSGIDVLMYGHLHTSFIRKYNDFISINPGSISLPKNNTTNSYAIIDNEKVTIKDINGNIIDSINY